MTSTTDSQSPKLPPGSKPLQPGDKIIGVDASGTAVISRAPPTSGQGSRTLPSDNPLLVNQVAAAVQAGYDPAAVQRAAVTGQPLLPSDNRNVQQFVEQARRQGQGFEVTPTQIRAVQPIQQRSGNLQYGFTNGGITGASSAQTVQTIIQPRTNDINNLSGVLPGKNNGFTFVDTRNSVPVSQVQAPGQQTISTQLQPLPLQQESIVQEIAAPNLKGETIQDTLLNIGENNVNQILSKQTQLETTGKSIGSGIIGGLEGFGLGVLDVGINTVSSVLHPLKTIESTLNALLTPQESIINPLKEIPNKILTGTPSQSGFLTGQVVGSIAVSELGGKALKSVVPTTVDLFVVAGSKQVPLSTIAQEETIQANVIGSTRGRFPLSSSLSQNIQSFKDTILPTGELQVVTASPQALSGAVSGAGSKAIAGLEDTGINTAPKGSASLAFLRLAPVLQDAEYTLNPFAGFKTPSITTFKVPGGIVQYPRAVISQPGFEAVSQFQKDVLAPQGAIVVSKRTEIGLGNIPAQTFVAPVDFAEKNFNIKQGDVRFEAGSSETAANIPQGTAFIIEKPNDIVGGFKGFSQYTVVNGRAVALPEARLLQSVRATSQESLLASQESVTRGSGAFSEIVSPTMRVSPYPSVIKLAGVSQLIKGSTNKDLTQNYERTNITSIASSKISPSSIFSPGESIISTVSTPKPSIIQMSSVSRPKSSSSSNSSVTLSPSVIQTSSPVISSQVSQVSVTGSSIPSSSSPRQAVSQLSYTFGTSNGGGSSGSGSSNKGSSFFISSLVKPGSSKVVTPTSKLIIGKSNNSGVDISYNVEVRGKGTKINGSFKPGAFIQVNRTPQTLEGAKSLLSEKLLGTAKMSGFLVPINATPGQRESVATYDSSKFVTNKKGYTVQTRMSAISSQGEKSEIRRKSQFGSSFKKGFGFSTK